MRIGIMTVKHTARLAADIGGTFTDLALEFNGQRFTTKVLTSTDAPERALIEGAEIVLSDAGLQH